MGVISFRILPAMYSTSPKYVEDTLENYVGYYSTNVAYIWNDKTKAREPLPIRQRLESLGLFVFNFTMYSIVLSIMLYYNFRPFNPNDKVQLEQFHLHTIVDLVRPTHLLNTYSQAGTYEYPKKDYAFNPRIIRLSLSAARRLSPLLSHMLSLTVCSTLAPICIVLTYFCLHVSFESNGMAENLKGYATVPIFSNPLFASRTPTEFWTKVSLWLGLRQDKRPKRSVYCPWKKYSACMGPQNLSCFGHLHVLLPSLQHDTNPKRLYLPPPSNVSISIPEVEYNDLQQFESTCKYVTFRSERIVGTLEDTPNLGC